MRKTNKTILHRTSFALLPIFLVSNAAADETIIQSEKISFEKCLEVIATSQNKLLIAQLTVTAKRVELRSRPTQISLF